MWPKDRNGREWKIGDEAVAPDGRLGRVSHRFNGHAGTVTLTLPVAGTKRASVTEGFSPTQIRRVTA